MSVSADVLAQFQFPTRITEKPALTGREMQVLVGISFGHTNPQIGRKLGLTEDTIKSHARSLFKKLDASDRAHAVRVGLELGILASSIQTVAASDTEAELSRSEPLAALMFRGAKALYERYSAHVPNRPPFHHLDRLTQSKYRERALAVLVAAFPGLAEAGEVR